MTLPQSRNSEGYVRALEELLARVLDGAKCIEEGTCTVERAWHMATAQATRIGEPRYISLPSEKRRNYIRCVWVPEKEWGYGKAMRVVESDHPRFAVGTRFDYGFLKIAIEEGYAVHVEAVTPEVQRQAEEFLK